MRYHILETQSRQKTTKSGKEYETDGVHMCLYMCVSVGRLQSHVRPRRVDLSSNSS